MGEVDPSRRRGAGGGAFQTLRFSPFILLAALLLPAPALAVGVVPPIPRIPDADLRPAEPPKEEPPKADPDEDPAKVVERIAATAETVGDRLKDKDTGTDTRKQQEQLLKDIDSLLKPPPPMNNGGGGGGMSDVPPTPMPPPPMPPPPGGGMPPPMGGGGMPPPQGGGGRQKPPRGSRGEGQPKEPMPMGMGGMTEPMPGGPPPMPMGKEPMGMGKEPMQPGGAGANAGNGGQKSPPALPLDVPITKEVWGHLPEKMRQEVSQYYKEQYLPRYNELLKQYYIALAERERQKKK